MHLFVFNCPNVKKKFSSDPIVIYYVLNSNLFYTQLAFALVPQKDSYYAIFLFLLQ